MKTLESYQTAFRTVAFNRTDGVLEMRLHSEGGPFRCTVGARHELEQAFLAISRDGENEIVILTGTGNEFTGPEVFSMHSDVHNISATRLDPKSPDRNNLLNSFLSLDVPVISAVNGPVRWYPALPLLADIVLAAEVALFQESIQVQGGLIAGYGAHVVYPYLMGPTRANYFLLTGQELSSAEALRLGLVNEVLKSAALLPRASILARQLMKLPRRERQLSRQLRTHKIRNEFRAELEREFPSFALEARANATSG